MFDLSVFDSKTAANTGAVMHLELPDGSLAYNEDTPVTITLLGYESDKSKKLVVQQLRKKRLQGKGKREQEITLETLEQSEQEDADMLAELTVSWTGFEEKGKALPCDKETARHVYLTYSRIRKQALDFLRNDSNFVTEKTKA